MNDMNSIRIIAFIICNICNCLKKLHARFESKIQIGGMEGHVLGSNVGTELLLFIIDSYKVFGINVLETCLYIGDILKLSGMNLELYFQSN